MIGDIISAGAKLVGGYMDNEAAEDRNAAVLADKNRDRELQREFAQHGIRWRVEDAKAAGLHPIYALSGGGATYTPSAISLEGGGMGKALADMGQDVGRAINATRTSGERESAFTKTANDLTLQNFALKNELLAAQIAKLKASQNPSLPSVGDDPVVPGQGGVTVPRADKFEERPRLAVEGREWKTDPRWANAEDFEKRYGDDGPPSWLFNSLIAWNDYKRNVQSSEMLDSAARRMTGRNAPAWAHRLLKRGKEVMR